MAAPRTGKDGTVMIIASGGTLAAVAKIRSWKSSDKTEVADGTASGDVAMVNVALRANWEFTFDAVLEIANPYTLPTALKGLAVDFAGKVLAADTNGLVSGTGLLESLDINDDYKDVVTYTGRIIPTGSILAYDTSPAT